jgi:ABC-type uncharacterized transport system permease subunit
MSLAGVVSYRAGLWNIGQEGQAIIGALATISSRSPAEAVAYAALAAGGWILMPAALRAVMNVNEAVTTFLTSLAAVALARYFIEGPLKDPTKRDFVVTLEAPYMSLLYAVALFVGLLAFVVLLYKTRIGLTTRLLSAGEDVVRYAGRRSALYILAALGLSGVFAGIGGALEIMTRDAGRYMTLQQVSTGCGRNLRRVAGGPPPAGLRRRLSLHSLALRRRSKPKSGEPPRLGGERVGGHSHGVGFGRLHHVQIQVGMAVKSFSIASEALKSAAPILLATLGAVVGQRAGVLYLGLEGVVYISVAVAAVVGPPWGFLAAVAVGTLYNLLYYVLSNDLALNQILLGFAFTMVGYGVVSQVARDVVGTPRGSRWLCIYFSSPGSGWPSEPPATTPRRWI